MDFTEKGDATKLRKGYLKEYPLNLFWQGSKGVEGNGIPESTIARLSIYYRTLSELAIGETICSEKLAALTGFTAAQIRRDLTYFGQFGTPGKGYSVEELKKNILRILGIDREWKIALIGVGNLGSALLTYQGFREKGFKIVAAFDNDLRKLGKSLENIKIQDIEELPLKVGEEGIDMAIIAVPAKAAQEVIDLVVEAGVKAILNFVPVRVRVPSGVKLLNIDMTIELERLSYYVSRKTGKG